MTSLMKYVARREYSERIQWVKNQTEWFRRSGAQVNVKNPLNKTFIEPTSYPNLRVVCKNHIISTLTVLAGAGISPLITLDSIPLVGRVAAACMLVPTICAIRNLYQLRYISIPTTREVELAQEYADYSDVEIKEELKQNMRGMLPNDRDFYDELTQSLMKPWINHVSIERACVPMLIRYQVILEKYQALEERFPLMEAIGDQTPPEMRGKVSALGGLFFQELFHAKLESAFALMVLCYPTDIEASHLDELGQENPYFPENVNVEHAEVPFFIKKGCQLTKDFHSYKFVNRNDFISCKQMVELSLQQLAEELMTRINVNNLVIELNAVDLDPV